MRIRVLGILILVCACFCGCQKKKESNVDTVKESIVLEESQEDEEPEKRSLQFVDVYGASYQMTVNPQVKANLYRPELFVNQNGRMTYAGEDYQYRFGIDVSKYQGDIDWQKVKADGVEFVIIRLGYRGYSQEGSLNVDPLFETNIKGARAAGLDVGVYFFAQAINEAEAIEEAEFVLKQLEGYDLQMPIVYDPESILDDESRTDDVTGEQFTKNTKAFCETVEEAGHDAMIYCNMLWQAYELDLQVLEEYPIWYADYEPYPQTPYHFEMWQYSQSGKVDGVSGNVDMNIQMIQK